MPFGALIRAYFRSGKEIVRLREAAIRGAMDDPRALAFGIAFFLISSLFFAGTYLVLFEVVPSKTPLNPNEPSLGVQLWVGVGAYTLIGFTALFFGHAVIKWISGSKESLLRLMRAVMLGSVVMLLNVIPAFGAVVGGVWWAFRVVPGVTRVVHGIGFGKALGIYLLCAVPAGAIWIPVLRWVVMSTRN